MAADGPRLLALARAEPDPNVEGTAAVSADVGPSRGVSRLEAFWPKSRSRAVAPKVPIDLRPVERWACAAIDVAACGSYAPTSGALDSAASGICCAERLAKAEDMARMTRRRLECERPSAAETVFSGRPEGRSPHAHPLGLRRARAGHGWAARGQNRPRERHRRQRHQFYRGTAPHARSRSTARPAITSRPLLPRR